jgi:hypothetical protein
MPHDHIIAFYVSIESIEAFLPFTQCIHVSDVYASITQIINKIDYANISFNNIVSPE